ncbi:MAG: flavodoxin family protein [Clostridia bacterium]|nr:flavodoxin family protein [Clostridia bacterium]
MKVILINGSPHPNGCTATALREVGGALQASGVESEVFWIGRQAVQGCVACGGCANKGKCVWNDNVNEFVDLACAADGFVFGSPVYFAGMNGSMMSFMDRAFFSALKRPQGSPFLYKPAAAVVSARRAGTTAAIDQMNKYFLHGQMPIISSRYWNMVHGNTPEEVAQDAEGLQIMRQLGRNMAWFLKLKEAGQAAGIPLPEQESTRIATNFIR